MTDDPAREAGLAARSGDLVALRRLLGEHPELADARLGPYGGRTLLAVATDWPGHFPAAADVIALVVAAGASPDQPCLPDGGERPLHWAASSGDLAALDALLDAGADLHAEGAVIAGGTAMADATAFGQWAAARRLLERGSRTTLFEAASLGLAPVVESFLAGGAGPDEITSGLWGACHGGQRATAELLLEHGGDLNWTGYDQLTPLDVARRSGATDLIQWLESRGR
ncbi:hypothetical protein GCM10022223_62910 [Kineosporia mesophila]|uniref:Ankyrin repeat protein n=1 Tax=Kineosporia mesophila TaxID=566012 RepID=A0ABP7AMN6_9ACTN|nr:ankyrin repeat domain-containing protein [Kineosporia mesophila]MCD5354557.1 ankyrin repeat domain-containing protein [Kineosporia mesophila]